MGGRGTPHHPDEVAGFARLPHRPIFTDLPNLRVFKTHAGKVLEHTHAHTHTHKRFTALFPGLSW